MSAFLLLVHNFLILQRILQGKGPRKRWLASLPATYASGLAAQDMWISIPSLCIRHFDLGHMCPPGYSPTPDPYSP